MNETDQIQDKKKKPVFLILLLILLALGGFGYFGYQGYNSASQTQQNAQSIDQSEETSATDTTTNADDDDNYVAPIINENATAPLAETAANHNDGKDWAIDHDPNDGVRSLGNPNAPVKMIEYASLTCHHCANFHKNTLSDIIKRYVSKGDVYIEFRAFPLNAPALDGAVLARCLPEGNFFPFISLLFETQESWAERPDYTVSLLQNAKLAGLDNDAAQACLDNPNGRAGLAGGIRDATQKWEVKSTPTFVVNDGAEIIRGAQPLYEFERVFRKVSDGKVAPLKPTEKE